MSKDNPLLTRDWLAIERTKLANERTFLAYFRTFLVLLGTGITILKLELLSELKYFGVALICTSVILLIIGLIRLFKVKKTIRNLYNKNQ